MTTDGDDDVTTNDDTDDDQPDETPPGDDGRFDADYVAGLRSENAQRRREAQEQREKADRADERLRTTQAALVDLTINTAAAGVLASPDDLTRYVPAAELVDADGNPDAGKVKAAAEKLAKDRPHLAPRAPAVTGDVDQGPRPAGPAPFDFSQLLRNAAG